MAPDIDQQDLALGNLQRQRDAIAVGEAHRLQALELAAEGMQAQAGLERVVSELRQRFGKASNARP